MISKLYCKSVLWAFTSGTCQLSSLHVGMSHHYKAPYSFISLDAALPLWDTSLGPFYPADPPPPPHTHTALARSFKSKSTVIYVVDRVSSRHRSPLPPPPPPPPPPPQVHLCEYNVTPLYIIKPDYKATPIKCLVSGLGNHYFSA